MSDRFYGDVLADVTSVTAAVLLRSTTDSSALTGIASGGITAFYWRQGASAAVSISTSALAALNTAFTAGGWREVSSTNMPGLYRFDIPDLAFAAGADWVNVQVKVTAGTGFNFDAQYRIQSAAMLPDQVWKRDLTAVSGEARRSPLNAIRVLLNRLVVTPTALSVKKEDDTTEAWSATLSTTSGAAPITGIDPTG